MGNSFRVDRVGMEIKREVNEILQKPLLKMSLSNTVIKLMKCFVIWSVKTKQKFLSVMAGILRYNRVRGGLR